MARKPRDERDEEIRDLNARLAASLQEAASLRVIVETLTNPQPVPEESADFEIRALARSLRLSFVGADAHTLTSGRFIVTAWPVKRESSPKLSPVEARPLAPAPAVRPPVSGAVLAARIGCTDETLRKWIGAGLIPERGPAGYGPEAQRRADLARTLRETLPRGKPVRPALALALAGAKPCAPGA